MSEGNGHSNGHSNGHGNGHSNGHANGHGNGHGNGHSNGHRAANGANSRSNGHSGAPSPAGAPLQVPIAVCGTALRLPGGLSTPKQFWEFLLAKGDARGRVPASRYNVSAFSSAGPGASETEYGYFLDESVNLASFDAAAWNMSRQEAERSTRSSACCSKWHVRASRTPARRVGAGTDTGCYVGSVGDDWAQMLAKETQPHGPYRAGDSMPANRLSRMLDLRGPSVTVRTGDSAAHAGPARGLSGSLAGATAAPPSSAAPT